MLYVIHCYNLIERYPIMTLVRFKRKGSEEIIRSLTVRFKRFQPKQLKGGQVIGTAFIRELD